MTGAVFLDRDGTVIADTGYLDDPADVRLLEGAATGLRALGATGRPIVVVSNQSGIGRGWISVEAAAMVHDRFMEVLDGEGVELAGCYYCPHEPSAGCACRKPAAGLLDQAATDLTIDLNASIMVGDRGTDVEAGHVAGCRSILIGDEHDDDHGAWAVAPDLESAVRLIVGDHR